MFALDFKLTSAQVRELLYIWHGASLHEGDYNSSYPALNAMGHSLQFYQVGEVLERKGLVVKRPPDAKGHTGVGRQDAPDLGSIRFSCTPAGAAIAEMIVTQAQIVMMVDASRRERLARVLAPQEDAHVRG